MTPEEPFGGMNNELTGPRETLRLQREINQELLLAALRSSEQADDAELAQRRAELEAKDLRLSDLELRETAELRERLIGIIGHDLRTPLSAILMSSNRLLGRGNLVADDVKLAQLIVRSGQRMSRMIASLVEFTRARLGGVFSLSLAPTDLGEICRTIAEELRAASSSELEVSTSGDVTGSWDRDRLLQALSNIAGNAVDHADAGSAVQIRVVGEESCVSAAIRNRGACIPAEVLPRIFLPFHGSQNDGTRKSGHLGLGLYVACEIARAHGGSVRVHSADRATTFTLCVPRRPDRSA